MPRRTGVLPASPHGLTPMGRFGPLISLLSSPEGDEARRSVRRRVDGKETSGHHGTPADWPGHGTVQRLLRPGACRVVPLGPYGAFSGTAHNHFARVSNFNLRPLGHSNRWRDEQMAAYCRTEPEPEDQPSRFRADQSRLTPTAEELSSVQEVLAIFGGKWVGAILVELHGGPRRNFQLRLALNGVSAKMLSESLRRLLRDGLITHAIHEDGCGQVGLGYALTNLGRSGVELLGVMRNWAGAHLVEVEANRAQLDGHLEVS
jgi:DNA-binding HxlR family transcriptional regulator